VIDRFWLLVQIALRNLRASPLNLVVGLLILFGTFFFVVLGGLIDSLSGSMSKSVVGSLAGDLQVYSAASKDELALFGGGMGGDQNLAAITDFPRLKAELLKLPDVKEVVPMGVAQAIVRSGNILDVKLEKLRELYKVRAGQPSGATLETLTPEELSARITRQRDHLRQIIRVLESDSQQGRAMADAKTIDEEALAALARVSADGFWEQLDADPFPQLEFLENRIAPQVSDAQLLFLRYVGTDLGAFQRSFDRMRIVKGTAVPPGQRGFLVSDFIYEEQMKLKTARRLDKIRDALANGRTISGDAELQRFVKENRNQVRELVLQLDARQTAAAVARLQSFLGEQGGDLPGLLAKLLDTSDADFQPRYDFFYRELAPWFQLYKVRLGDQLTIKAFTRSGYVSSVNIKVYGTFAFRGIEDSILAGATNLMDIVSFRDLYGYLTADRAEELKALQKKSGTKSVTRETAEAELFGGESEVEALATEARIDVDRELSGTNKASRREDLLQRVYTQAELDDGVVLNAAIIVKDPKRRADALEAVTRLSAEKQLGLKAVTWQQAAGQLGSMVDVFRIILVVAVALVFFVAMIIINIAMMMATLQRTQMIGTLRAIGAQRGFVLVMMLNESVVLGTLFGGAGMALGALFMTWLGHHGIAAFNDISRFLFSGPRLMPVLSPFYLGLAFVLIMLVTVLSTLFPAAIATRISPLRAMQSDE
jgi:ABC-type lipoprotein release transport system permease subunit